jgi:hypothetical protein
VPRSTANCLDLAVLVAGRHLGTLFGLWALFAVPLGAAAWFSARYFEKGYLATPLLLFFGTGPLGVMLIAGVARYSFGEDWNLRKSLAELKTDWPLMLRSVALRIPRALLAMRWSFLTENQVFTNLHAERHDRRTKELIKLEGSDLFVRGGGIFVAGCLFWLVAELTVDTAWTILFNQSLFFGRFGELGSVAYEVEFESYLGHVWTLAFTDPAVVALHVTTGLAVYMLCRLAWYFCYIDLRVRRDCWDLELEILDEARRLTAERGLRT